MHISARATARPPSLRSWQPATSPPRIAACSRAVAGRRVGVGLRGGADRAAGGAEHEVEVAAGELGRASRRGAAATLPGVVSSAVTQRPTSGTWATAVMTSVGGTAWRCRRRRCTRCSASPCPTRTARRRRARRRGSPRTAATSSPSVAGRRGSPHEKLSRSATWSGSAPTATTLRMASSTTAWAIASGSCSPYHGLTPMPTAMPWVSRGSASTTPSPGRRSRRRRAGARPCRRRSRGRSGGSSSPWRRCCGGRAGRAASAAGSATVRAPGVRSGAGSVGGHPPLRPAVVEEGRVEVEHDAPRVAHDEAAVAGERRRGRRARRRGASQRACSAASRPAGRRAPSAPGPPTARSPTAPGPGT